jgi:hypothetical protein
MNYNVGTDSPTGYMSSTWMEAAGQDGIPTAFVIDKEGKIAWIGHPMAGLDEVLGDMIAGKFDAAAEKAKEEKQASEQAGASALRPYLAAMGDKDFKKAVEEIDKLTPTHPEMMDTLIVAKFDALARSDAAAANEFAKSSAAGDAKSKPEVLNSIAWTMVDDTDGQVKGMDFGLAETIAAQAIAQLKSDDAQQYAETLDTLALAQYKNGKTGDALATEKRAIEMFSQIKGVDADTLKEMRSRLKKYEDAKN